MTRDIVLGALRDLETTKAKLTALLDTFDAAEQGIPSVPLKKDNGRLTEAGIIRLRSMVDAERTDTEIANELDVTPAAIRPHRHKYAIEKVASKPVKRIKKI